MSLPQKSEWSKTVPNTHKLHQTFIAIESIWGLANSQGNTAKTSKFQILIFRYIHIVWQHRNARLNLVCGPNATSLDPPKTLPHMAKVFEKVSKKYKQRFLLIVFCQYLLARNAFYHPEILPCLLLKSSREKGLKESVSVPFAYLCARENP
jgi:hypothetical protein